MCLADTDHMLHILGLLGIWPASMMTSESMVPISGSCHKSLSLEMSCSRMGFLRSPMPSHAPAQHATLVTEHPFQPTDLVKIRTESVRKNQLLQ